MNTALVIPEGIVSVNNGNSTVITYNNILWMASLIKSQVQITSFPGFTRNTAIQVYCHIPTETRLTWSLDKFR